MRARQVSGLREIPIGSAPAEKALIREPSLSGTLSIGRFVVSRWHVCGGRGYGYSIAGRRSVSNDNAGVGAEIASEAFTTATSLDTIQVSKAEKRKLVNTKTHVGPSMTEVHAMKGLLGRWLRCIKDRDLTSFRIFDLFC